MIVGAVVFLAIAGVFLLALPRRYAAVPLLLAAAYTARNPLLELGPANLSALRLLVIIGVVRVIVRGERLANGLNAIDGWLIAWTTVLIGSCLFHTPDQWTFRLGMVLGEVGTYFLLRIFVQDVEDVRRLFKVLCLGLLPLAGLMLLEKATAHNYFGIMGTGELIMRDGHVRAYGPFGHPILAGCVGATCVAMALCLWRSNRTIAFVGMSTGLGIVLASTSSGPFMMTVFICLALFMWNVRDSLRPIRWATIALIIALQIVMNDPVYFLMARIDLTGSSTGWFRSQLIRSSLEHLSEWWIVGTDYTRHWMSSGIPGNNNHTDMTNHFLQIGVWGGLPLLLLFVMMLRAGFRRVGKTLAEFDGRAPDRAFLTWALGAILFGQVINFWSITLFDQSVTFFYLVLAMIEAVALPVFAAAGDAVAVAPVPGSYPLSAALPVLSPQVARTVALPDRGAVAARIPRKTLSTARRHRLRPEP